MRGVGGGSFLEDSLDLLVDVLGGEAQFFVEHFVGCTEAEAVESPDAAVGSDESFEVHGQSGGESELLHACGENGLLVILGLGAEQPFGGYADDAHFQAVLAQ